MRLSPRLLENFMLQLQLLLLSLMLTESVRLTVQNGTRGINVESMVQKQLLSQFQRASSSQSGVSFRHDLDLV